MARVQVKVQAEDENYPIMRKMSIRTNSANITTPIRSFHLKRETTSESRLIQNDKVRGINEIYHELTKQKIEEIDSDVDKLSEWGKKLRYVFTVPKIKDELNLLYFTYENKDRITNRPNSLPTDTEIEYLCNIVTHPTSEIIIPPLIPNLSGKDYLIFLKKFFKFLDSYGKQQTIMGNIPIVSTKELRDINQFYFESGVNLFSIDFDGKYPMDSYLLVNEVRRLSSEIKKEYDVETFMHAFNVPSPKSQVSKHVTPAKDILTFASGFDSYGTNHKGLKIPPHIAEEMNKKNKQNMQKAEQNNTRYIPAFRLFNRSDYGYYKNDAEKLETIFSDTQENVIKLSDLANPNHNERRSKGFHRAFNVEMQALEALEYHVHIEESTINEHVKEKEYGKENFQRIGKLIKQH